MYKTMRIQFSTNIQEILIEENMLNKVTTMYYSKYNGLDPCVFVDILEIWWASWAWLRFNSMDWAWLRANPSMESCNGVVASMVCWHRIWRLWCDLDLCLCFPWGEQWRGREILKEMVRFGGLAWIQIWLVFGD